MQTREATRTRTRLRSLWPESLAVLGLTLVVVLPVWPGVFTIDSQSMLRAARAGAISNWYSPIIQWAWGRLDAIGIPPAAVVVVTVAGLATAVLACFRLALPRTASMVATAAMVLWPPVYGLAGWVGRDVWFSALVTAQVALHGWAIRRPRHRGLLTAAAVGAAWFAADARQNGFPTLLVAGGMAGWAWAQHDRARCWPRVALAVVVAALVGGGSLVVVRSAVVTDRFAPDEVLYYQDLVAMSLRRDEWLVPAGLRRTDDLDTLRRQWDEGQVGSVTFAADSLLVYEPFRPGHGATVRRAWVRAIRAHPLDYVVVRGRLSGQMLGLRPGMTGAWFDRSDALDWSDSADLGQRFGRLADLRASYLGAFDGARGQPGWPHHPWPYLLLGVIGSVALIVVGGSARVLGVATLALQVLLQGVLGVAAPLVEFRFEYFQVVLGPVLAGVGLVSWWRAGHGDDPWTAAAPPDRPHRDHGPDEVLSPDRV